jgi:hypothetical protein
MRAGRQGRNAGRAALGPVRRMGTLLTNCRLIVIQSCVQLVRHLCEFKKPLRQWGFLVSAEGLEPSTP